MNKAAAHLRHFIALISSSRKAGLSFGDTVRLLCADYGSRIARSRIFTITIDGARMAIRSNPVDYRIVLEVFGAVYSVQPSTHVTRILDLGANIGASSVYFQRRFPEASIACVEPSPGNLAMLKTNQSLNGLSFTIFDCAVGTQSGTTTFYDTDDPSCCSLLHGDKDATQVLVSLKTIPQMMLDLEWDRIDILKIDIEGYEKVLFANSPQWLARVSMIVGEIHEGYTVDQLKADLAPFSFNVTISSPPNDYGQAIFIAVAPATLTGSRR